jgi:catechol 2,3-dioxygenase-like lactoylglutathione lyase family enzyme
MLDVSRSYSGFAVKDLEAAKAFYRDKLGIEVSSLYDGGLLQLQLGERVVLVYPKDDFVPATYTILNFPVSDVEVAVDELASKGVQMQRYEGFEQDAKGIASGAPGPTIAWFKDPSGNILAVHSDEQM